MEVWLRRTYRFQVCATVFLQPGIPVGNRDFTFHSPDAGCGIYGFVHTAFWVQNKPFFAAFGQVEHDGCVSGSAPAFEFQNTVEHYGNAVENRHDFHRFVGDLQNFGGCIYWQ
jgi:hypothetical protein